MLQTAGSHNVPSLHLVYAHILFRWTTSEKFLESMYQTIVQQHTELQSKQISHDMSLQLFDELSSLQDLRKRFTEQRLREREAFAKVYLKLANPEI